MKRYAVRLQLLEVYHLESSNDPYQIVVTNEVTKEYITAEFALSLWEWLMGWLPLSR